MSAKTIYFVAGESSGDNHGAALMQSLRRLDPALHFAGRGGPQMSQVAGGTFQNWIDRAAVVGLWEVIKNYGYFRAQFRQTLDEIRREKPAAVVLIDYPGFNLRLSRALRRDRRIGELWARDRRIGELWERDRRIGEPRERDRRIGEPRERDRRIGEPRERDRRIGEPREWEDRPRLLYYISPQVWAWNRRRIKKMAEWLDLMLCIFPFEEELYNQSGLRTVFVGHPMHERLEAQRSASARDRNLVAMFPGSRQREVRKILPIMLEAAAILKRRFPRLRFDIVAASPGLAAEINARIAKSGDGAADMRVVEGRAAAAMQEAWVGIVASGSATLEAAWFRLPFVLVYKVSWLTYMAGRMVIQVDYLGMPNVIAGRAVVPEFIQHHARPNALANEVARLIEDESARHQMISAFDRIIGTLGAGGASDRAAAVIMEELEQDSSGPALAS